MNRKTAGGLLTALSLAVVGAVAPASAAQAVLAFDVTVVSANGSGCPDATASAQAVDDSTFTVDGDSYYAWSGEGAAATEARRNCQFALQITRPAGWTYAVSGADYSGYAALEAGASGRQAAHYYFQGESDTLNGSHTFTGAFNGPWDYADAFADEDLRFAACDSQANLNINTEVAMTTAATGLNWVYANPSFTVHLTWQPCA